jgi:hypothetical protein
VSGAEFTASDQDRKPLTTIFYRLGRAQRRMARIEAALAGAPPAEASKGRRKRQGPSAKTIAGLQQLLDGDDPRVAHLRHSLAAEIARDVSHEADAIHARLTRAIEVLAQHRRGNLHVIEGGRPERGGPPNDGDIPF